MTDHLPTKSPYVGQQVQGGVSVHDSRLLYAHLQHKEGMELVSWDCLGALPSERLVLRSSPITCEPVTQVISNIGAQMEAHKQSGA